MQGSTAQNLKELTTLMALMVALSACAPAGGAGGGSAASSPSSTTTTGGNQTTGQTQTGGTVGTSSTKPTVTGTWKQACKSIGGEGSKTTYTFGAPSASGTASATMVVLVYADTNCSTMGATVNATGTFTIGDALSSPSGAFKMDMSITHATITPASFLGALAMNSASICGITNWASGVAQDVTGKRCEGYTVSSGATDYDIVGVSGSGLSLGSHGAQGTSTDGTSDTTRPSQFETQPYVKQ